MEKTGAKTDPVHGKRTGNDILRVSAGDNGGIPLSGPAAGMDQQSILPDLGNQTSYCPIPAVVPAIVFAGNGGSNRLDLFSALSGGVLQPCGKIDR